MRVFATFAFGVGTFAFELGTFAFGVGTFAFGVGTFAFGVGTFASLREARRRHAAESRSCNASMRLLHERAIDVGEDFGIVRHHAWRGLGPFTSLEESFEMI